MPIYPYSFTLPPVNKQDIPSDGVAGEFLGINSGGQLDWLPVSGGSGSGDLLAANNLSELTPTSGTARTNLGLGTGDSPTFANLTLTSPSLSSSAPVTISQTWNAGTNVMTALRLNVTDTASGPLSNLLSVKYTTSGGVVKDPLYLTKAGVLSLYMSQESGGIDLASYGFLSAFNWQMRNSNGYIGLGATATEADTRLYRDSANTLALRNGAGVPQAFRVYNTFLGTTANEWFEIDWKTTAGSLRLATTSGGTGVARSMEIIASGQISLTTGSGHPIDFRPAGVTRWTIHTPGNLWATTDNTYDIGASGASRPRNVYAGTSFLVAATTIANQVAAGTYLSVRNNNVFIDALSSGVLLLQDGAGTSFGRFQLGGTTDAFPAIARDGAGIKFTGAAAGSTAWIKVPPVAVGSLPVAATAGAGARAFVNDALAPTFGSAVTGGGAVLVPVYCTGSAWNVG